LPDYKELIVEWPLLLCPPLVLIHPLIYYPANCCICFFYLKIAVADYIVVADCISVADYVAADNKIAVDDCMLIWGERGQLVCKEVSRKICVSRDNQGHALLYSP